MFKVEVDKEGKTNEKTQKRLMGKAGRNLGKPDRVVTAVLSLEESFLSFVETPKAVPLLRPFKVLHEGKH